MALTQRHWILAAVISCAIIAAAKLPPDDPDPTPLTRRTVQLRARTEAARTLGREVATLVLLDRRDSALRVMRHAPTPAAGAPLVVHAPQIPAGLRARIDSAIARDVAALHAPLGASPVFVWVIADAVAVGDSTMSRYVPVRNFGSQYVLPEQTDGRTCLSILRVGAIPLNRVKPTTTRPALDSELQKLSGRLLGPCAYYGAHGTPGRDVSRWLAATRFTAGLRAPAAGADSLRARIRLTPRRGRLEWLADEAEWSYLRHYVAHDAVACVEGALGRCRAAIGEEMMPDGDPAWALIPEWSSGFMSRAQRERSIDLGPGEAWFLASLHDEIGPEAFGQFWRSDLPVSEAYESATGITLAAATQRWLQASLAPGSRRRWPGPWALGAQLVLAASVVGTSVTWRRRRGVEM